MNDLILHFGFGALITAAILLIFSKPTAGRRPDWLVVLAVGASLTLGGIKEAGDLWLGWGTPEVADLTLTWSGGIVALAVIAMVDWIIYVICFNRNKR